MSRVRIVLAQASALALLLVSGSVAFAQGTSLSVNVSAVAAACVNGASDVTVSYTVSSTGAADAATVGYSVGEGSDVALPTIASGTGVGAWTQGAGSTKTATGQFHLTLGTGEYDIEVCAEQNGAASKSDCSTVHVQVACTQVEGCDQSATLFGEVVGNKNLCQSESHVNVHLNGLFGPWATIEVKNPNGLVVETRPTDRAGDSCNYHWNLDPKAWLEAVAGVYTFSVEGANGASHQFGASLSCSKPGRR